MTSLDLQNPPIDADRQARRLLCQKSYLALQDKAQAYLRQSVVILDEMHLSNSEMRGRNPVVPALGHYERYNLIQSEE